MSEWSIGCCCCVGEIIRLKNRHSIRNLLEWTWIEHWSSIDSSACSGRLRNLRRICPLFWSQFETYKSPVKGFLGLIKTFIFFSKSVFCNRALLWWNFISLMCDTYQSVFGWHRLSKRIRQRNIQSLVTIVPLFGQICLLFWGRCCHLNRTSDISNNPVRCPRADWRRKI